MVELILQLLSPTSGLIRSVCLALFLAIATISGAQNVDLSTLPDARGSVFTHPFIGNGYGNFPVSGIEDFNGDGFSDFAIGLPETRISGQSNAGRVNIVYGSAMRASTFALSTLATDNGFGFQIDGADANAFLGRSVYPVGDFNGDGYSDFTVSFDGSAYVILGSAGTQVNFTISEVTTNSAFGIAISGTAYTSAAGVGDVNGDGYDDIAASVISSPGTTSIYIIFGKSHPGNINLADFTGNGQDGFIIRAPSTFYLGGMPAGSASCDFNGDGFHDVVIGGGIAKFSGTQGIPLMVFPGRSSGFNDYIIPDPGPSGLWPPPPEDLIYFELEAGDPLSQFAYSFGCAGDFDDDGKSDLFIGSTQFHESGRNSAGTIYLLLGHSGASGAIPLNLADPATAGIRIVGAANDNLGFGIAAAGDVDSDGKADLLVRSNRPFPGTEDTKSAFVLYGRESTAGDIDLAEPISSSICFQIGSLGSSSWNPFNTAGDVDGDGFDDILVTTKYPAVDATYLLFGKVKGSKIAGWEAY